MRRRGARSLTDFGSSVNAVRAVASFLQGRDHSALPILPGSRLLADALTRLPERGLAAVFRIAAATQGVAPRRTGHIDVDDLDDWVTRRYGPGPFPAVVIGATSGGAVHLAAALGVPFLPQTTLTSIRHRTTHPDHPTEAMTALAPVARSIAENNPRVAVYHMHDPAQDRPMLERFAFMRLKRQALGPIYGRFLAERLAPGGTIIQTESSRDWRTREVGERTFFQFGSLGGVPEEEYHDSGERIATYLAQQHSPARRWEPPEMDARRPEGEWGWDPALGQDLAELADRHGYRLRRLVGTDPQDHSGFVAELYRWWYRRIGAPDDRLLVETYAQWDPWWILRTASVPYWIRFHTEPEYQELERYLQEADPFERIYINLLSHGVRSPGVVSPDQWEHLGQRYAADGGEVIGVDRGTYPLDAGSTLRYNAAFKAIPYRQPLPDPLRVGDVDDFAAQGIGTAPVSWL